MVVTMTNLFFCYKLSKKWKKRLALTFLYCLGQETWLDESWKLIYINHLRFYNFFHVRKFKNENITSKYFRIFNKKLPASWAALIIRDFITFSNRSKESKGSSQCAILVIFSLSLTKTKILRFRSWFSFLYVDGSCLILCILLKGRWDLGMVTQATVTQLFLSCLLSVRWCESIDVGRFKKS